MACDPAQDSANLAQALAAIVNTCTSESSPEEWSIPITNSPVIDVVNSGLPVVPPIMLLLPLAGLSPNPTPLWL